VTIVNAFTKEMTVKVCRLSSVRSMGLLLFSLLFASPAWSAITFDMADSAEGTTSTSKSVTIAADANFAIICHAQRESGGAVGAPAAVPTLNGSNATAVPSGTTSVGGDAEI
jgi:hypothetical protein